jgi:hypothetical protein
LTQNFGWPSVKTWIGWAGETSDGLAGASFATRELATIPVHAPLAEFRATEIAAASGDIARGALAAIAAFDPATWSSVRLRLWREKPEGGCGQHYSVNYVALGPTTG